YGNWHDDQPRWSAATGRIYFSSDRDGLFQLYSVDSTGAGRRETNTLNGAFDPEWVESQHEGVFGGSADLSFNIYAPLHAVVVSGARARQPARERERLGVLSEPGTPRQLGRRRVPVAGAVLRGRLEQRVSGDLGRPRHRGPLSVVALPADRGGVQSRAL